MTRRKRNIIVVVVTALLALAGFVVWLGYQVSQVPRDAYAMWWTADLVIEHMEKNHGTWPRSWDELRSTSEQAYKGTVSTNRDRIVIAEFRPRDTINELQQRVEVDWNADPKELSKADFKEKSLPFRVIWLRSGKSRHYSGKEPNQMIFEYLKWKEKQIAGPDGSTNAIGP
jgi:hypothetical protein